MSIQFEDVSYSYPGGGAGVSQIDLSIGDGELVALIGASGSGKTTLLKLLAGFCTPDKGRIRVNGKPMASLPPEDRALGIVFQNYALFPHMTVRDNVAYPLRLRRVPRARRAKMADDVLDRVGLAGFGTRLPAALSGGQQQRVALARALVFSPGALLLDEPLSALDANIRLQMRGEIRRAQQAAGISALHVTHDQEEAFSIADRVAVMRAGRIVQIGTPQDLYDRPVDRELAAFVGQANLWDGRVAAAGRIATGFGELSCDTAGFAEGASVTVCVRPERILPDPEAGMPNTFRAAPTATEFLGPIRRITMQAGPTSLMIETHRRTTGDAFAIPPEAIRLLAS
ncbi:ABC transporter ATP-binding protein [Cereibacter sp. SYSU M97828]|nr:ABC transporter ATP-binding protein [Cereibacter flavus]